MREIHLSKYKRTPSFSSEKVNLDYDDWAVVLCAVVAFDPRRLVGMNAAAAGYIFDLQTNAEAAGRSRLMARSLVMLAWGLPALVGRGRQEPMFSPHIIALGSDQVYGEKLYRGVTKACNLCIGRKQTDILPD